MMRASMMAEVDRQVAKCQTSFMPSAETDGVFTDEPSHLRVVPAGAD